MKINSSIFVFLVTIALLLVNNSCAQTNSSNENIKKASKKVKEGFRKKEDKIAADGYYDLGEEYYIKGEFKKSEEYFTKAKEIYIEEKSEEGVSKSSRALGKVQEELKKNDEALKSYKEAENSSSKTGDTNAILLNINDVSRLNNKKNTFSQEKNLNDKILLNIKFKDTSELITSYNQLGNLGLSNNQINTAFTNFNNGYNLSKNTPVQARGFNQKITDLYIQNKDFDNAIRTKNILLDEPFVKLSTETKANETNQLAEIYLQKKETITAVTLLKESYNISIKNGHTLEAKRSVEKLDSLYRTEGKKDLSLAMYKQFVTMLPELVAKDSSLIDNKIILETEEKLKVLQEEKALKDDLIKKKNRFNFWLIASLFLLTAFIGIILYLLKKARIKNKQIALQSLRREMNPHFIFNSLNSINQFIANNNELAANQYLTKFSTLMRRVMENSKNDFVLFNNEIELLQNYLDLEKSRFTDKFEFKITIDDNLFANEQLYLPGMLIQPYLENAI